MQPASPYCETRGIQKTFETSAAGPVLATSLLFFGKGEREALRDGFGKG
jgi:hypothetical protein